MLPSFSSLLMLFALASIAGALSYYLSQQLVLNYRQDSLESFETKVNYSEPRHLMGMFLSEVVAILATLLVVRQIPLAADWDFGLIFLQLGVMGLVVTGLSLAWVDFQQKVLPASLTDWGLGLSVGALALSSLASGEPMRLLIMLAGAAIFFLLFGLFWFFNYTGFGLGDVRMSGYLGAILGYVGFGAVVAGLLLPWILVTLALVLVLPIPSVRRKLLGRDREASIAFGPWMLIAALLAFLYGDTIVSELVDRVIA